MSARSLSWIILVCFLGARSSTADDTVGVNAPLDSRTTITVPVARAWTPTGIIIPEGNAFQIDAEGSAVVIPLHVGEWMWGSTVDHVVGPRGTYRRPCSCGCPRAYSERTSSGCWSTGTR